MAFDLNTLDENKVTAPKITGPGVEFVEPKIIDFKKIWVNSQENNHARLEIDDNQVQALKVNFADGIRYEFAPPIVRELPQVIDGQAYEYELIDAHHRWFAMHELGYDRWIFWVYKVCLDGYSLDDSKITLQLKANNHYSSKSSTIEDAVGAICWLLAHNSRLVENTEQSIRDYIDMHCSNMNNSMKGSVVAKVMAKMNTYRRIVTYTANEAFSWINKHTDYPIRKGGEYDAKRKSHGWSVLEGYEYEQIFNAMKKYSETGKESYFICRTKSPTQKNDLFSKRNGMLNTIDQLESNLLDAFKYYQENGKFPWRVECFIPQDTELEENNKPIIV